MQPQGRVPGFHAHRPADGIPQRGRRVVVAVLDHLGGKLPLALAQRGTGLPVLDQQDREDVSLDDAGGVEPPVRMVNRGQPGRRVGHSDRENALVATQHPRERRSQPGIRAAGPGRAMPRWGRSGGGGSRARAGGRGPARSATTCTAGTAGAWQAGAAQRPPPAGSSQCHCAGRQGNDRSHHPRPPPRGLCTHERALRRAEPGRDPNDGEQLLRAPLTRQQLSRPGRPGGCQESASAVKIRSLRGSRVSSARDAARPALVTARHGSRLSARTRSKRAFTRNSHVNDTWRGS